jgi:hypothetical protein
LAKANTGLVRDSDEIQERTAKSDEGGKKGKQVLHLKKNILALWWRDKKNVWMLSSRHNDQICEDFQQAREGKMKPAAVDYNKHKARVDLIDQ